MPSPELFKDYCNGMKEECRKRADSVDHGDMLLAITHAIPDRDRFSLRKAPPSLMADILSTSGLAKESLNGSMSGMKDLLLVPHNDIQETRSFVQGVLQCEVGVWLPDEEHLDSDLVLISDRTISKVNGSFSNYIDPKNIALVVGNDVHRLDLSKEEIDSVTGQGLRIGLAKDLLAPEVRRKWGDILYPGDYPTATEERCLIHNKEFYWKRDKLEKMLGVQDGFFEKRLEQNNIPFKEALDPGVGKIRVKKFFHEGMTREYYAKLSHEGEPEITGIWKRPDGIYKELKLLIKETGLESGDILNASDSASVKKIDHPTYYKKPGIFLHEEEILQACRPAIQKQYKPDKNGFYTIKSERCATDKVWAKRFGINYEEIKNIVNPEEVFYKTKTGADLYSEVYILSVSQDLFERQLSEMSRTAKQGDLKKYRIKGKKTSGNELGGEVLSVVPSEYRGLCNYLFHKHNIPFNPNQVIGIYYGKIVFLNKDDIEPVNASHLPKKIPKRKVINSKEKVEKLFYENIDFPEKIARKFFRNYENCMNDLVQEGLIAMYRCAELFDEKKFSFKTFARRAIFRAIIRFISKKEKHVPLSNNLSWTVWKIDHFYDKYFVKNGYYPTTEEVAQQFGIEEEALFDLLIYSKRIPQSLDASLPDSEMQYHQLIQDPVSFFPIDRLYASDVEEKIINEVLPKFNPQYQEVFKMSTGVGTGKEPMNSIQIGAELNISGARVRKILKDNIPLIRQEIFYFLELEGENYSLA